jgi:hypothetical protein
MMILNFHVPDWRRDEVSQPNSVFGKIAAAALDADWRVVIKNEDEPVEGAGFHLVYNRAVTHPQALSLRRCYVDPFYRIEATNDRWDWQVARQSYTESAGNDWFRKHWAERLFKDLSIRKQGFVFMPLQGRLTEHRFFQSMSPIAMIKAALAADPDRQILATLHPRESYSAADRAALAAIKGRFSVVDTPSLALLADCDYVVTQNSSMALIGMFAQKTPVLFADIDFHHIAPSVPKQGLEAAYRNLHRPRPWGNYLHWFFRDHAVSMRAEDITSKLRSRFRDHGWPM